MTIHITRMIYKRHSAWSTIGSKRSASTFNPAEIDRSRTDADVPKRPGHELPFGQESGRTFEGPLRSV